MAIIPCRGEIARSSVTNRSKAASGIGETSGIQQLLLSDLGKPVETVAC
ncbi:MAG: hypothetical protein HC781_07780 [Leptolyngbyaceae cyanobacterium CSU_1_4]|nr:hypothetical protein [Leptolyngbyaceae cyanobacterium CSU_1_4]